ncbi:hypothetical protein OAF85_01560 [Planctomycetota bacterium]|nr:hypothetical protein [Planctomycetota bacterium]
MPRSGESVEIGFFDWMHSDTFQPISKSYSWNWQQGTQLQWLSGTSRFIFNDLRDGRFRAVISSIEGQEEAVLDSPIYEISPDGSTGLTIDYERHFWLRKGYHYEGVENAAKSTPYDPEDGIWTVDLGSGRARRIIRLGDVAELEWTPSMEGGSQYLEHMMFSPCGEKFCFLHRWRLKDGGIYSRLLTAEANGSNMRIVADSGRMSHFSWLGPSKIIAFGGVQKPWSSLRRGGGLRSRLFRLALPIYRKVVPVNSALRSQLTGDTYMILDTEGGGTV